MSKPDRNNFKGTIGEKTPSNDVVNQLPANDSQLKHIFRKAEGHLPDTPENRQLVTKVANTPANYVENLTARRYGRLCAI